MKNALAALLCMVVMAAMPWVANAEIQIDNRFVPGGQVPAEVLKDVEVKGLIAEFLDPGNTGLGKNMCYLLWREVLTAISDQGGAGLILARTPKGTRLTDLLARDYHRSAMEIALGQKARMALWGTATEADGRVYLESNLTLLPEVIGSDLSLTLKLGGTKIDALSTEVARSRYNFAVVETSREMLFERALIPLQNVEVLEQAAAESRTLATVKASDTLRAIGMDGAWFRVRLADGREGWVDNNQVMVPPRDVRIGKGQFEVTDDDAGRKNKRTLTLDGVYPVLDMRSVPDRGTVYRLDLGGSSAWLEASQAQARYSLPAVHFMAALYRYQLGNTFEATRALDAYLLEAEYVESNATLSSAHQFRVATMVSQPGVPLGALKNDLDRAVELTPYDPAVYRLRALAILGTTRDVHGAIPDLQHALELDRLDPASLRLLSAVWDLVNPAVTENPWSYIRYDLKNLSPGDVEAIHALRLKYPPTAY